MLLHRRFVPGLAIYSYLVGDEKSGEAAVIDASRDVSEFLTIAGQYGLKIRHILETHVHADFVSGALELKSRLNGEAKIYSSALGGEEWTPQYVDVAVADGDEIRFGDIQLRAFHTPGHTSEHICWSLYDLSRSRETPCSVFTGDFLFVGAIGRPDLLGAEAQKHLAKELWKSVFERLPAVPDFTEVFPAHGAGSLCGKALSSRASSTIGYERKFNPSLAFKPEEPWVAELLSDMPIAPRYFSRMKRVNQQGPRIIGLQYPGRMPLLAKQVLSRGKEGCQILDVRSKEAFAGAHIPGAINIPFGPNVATWAGWVLSYDEPIILIVEKPGQVDEVITSLLRVGLDNISGYLDGGMDSWELAGFELSSLAATSVAQVGRNRKDGGVGLVLDVRTQSEWRSGHIEGAINIHAGNVQGQLDELERDQPILVVCGSGYRATIAASILQRAGYSHVSNVVGGMTAWTNAGLPLVKELNAKPTSCAITP